MTIAEGPLTSGFRNVTSRSQSVSVRFDPDSAPYRNSNSIGTLRNGEQGRRKPQGPAKVLLKVAEKCPNATLESLSQ